MGEKVRIWEFEFQARTTAVVAVRGPDEESARMLAWAELSSQEVDWELVGAKSFVAEQFGGEDA